jgi:energy-coupling factor transporter ATP-binding protein EcfA2
MNPNVNYKLHSLGWKDFQNLCATIMSEVLGQEYVVFSDSHDGGRDGAFKGTWKRNSNAIYEGTFTVQCKFTNRINGNLSLSGLDDELIKANKLAKNGLADNYFLMTNFKISGTEEEKITTSFLRIPGIKEFEIFGENWITQKIKENDRLRGLVPRLYGLGDLGEIINKRVRKQAQAILKSMRDDIKTFVVTDAYKDSLEAISKHNFVLLLGEPASGKSTISANLAIFAADLWTCKTLKIKNSVQFTNHWDSDSSDQLFWIDDAFGTTQYQREKSYDWNTVFPDLRAAIKKGTKFIFTSRDYIYRAAKMDLKITGFPLIADSQVVIKVQDLKKQEKEQILYNHIKLGNQPDQFKTDIKTFLPKVVENKFFLPEIARRLGNQIFTKYLQINQTNIIEFVEKPHDFLISVLESLDQGCKAALLLIFMNGHNLEYPIEHNDENLHSIKLLRSTYKEVADAMEYLQDTLVKIVYSEYSSNWTFKHPTIADALASLIADKPEYLDVYLAGAKAGMLLDEVSCGEVNIEGVKVIIPPNRFDKFIRILQIYFTECMALRHGTQKFYSFLESRTSDTFLKYFLKQTPEFSNDYLKDSPLFPWSKAHLLSRLHQLKLLPDNIRKSFVTLSKEQIVDNQEIDSLSDKKTRILFSDEERKEILNAAYEEIFNDFENIISVWEDSYSEDDGDPEEYYAPLSDAVHFLSTQMLYYEKMDKLTDNANSSIASSIDYLAERYPIFEEEYDPMDYAERYHNIDSNTQERSIFDDVDQ